jgi:hypothetical protein
MDLLAGSGLANAVLRGSPAEATGLGYILEKLGLRDTHRVQNNISYSNVNDFADFTCLIISIPAIVAASITILGALNATSRECISVRAFGA